MCIRDSDNTIVRDDDRIFLGAKKIKGNSIYEVKFIQFGASSSVKNAEVTGGTIGDAAEGIIDINGFELRTAAGATVSASDMVDSDMKILLTKKVKGNSDYVEVKFIQFGGNTGPSTINVAPGSSVADAASAAEKSIDGFELRTASGTLLKPDSTIDVDTKILLTKKVKGNN